MVLSLHFKTSLLGQNGRYRLWKWASYQFNALWLESDNDMYLAIFSFKWVYCFVSLKKSRSTNQI